MPSDATPRRGGEGENHKAPRHHDGDTGTYENGKTDCPEESICCQQITGQSTLTHEILQHADK